jgi:hypothetical protein
LKIFSHFGYSYKKRFGSKYCWNPVAKDVWSLSVQHTSKLAFRNLIISSIIIVESGLF